MKRAVPGASYEAPAFMTTRMRVDEGPRRSNSTWTLLPAFRALTISRPPCVSIEEIDMPIWAMVETAAGFTRAIGAAKVRALPAGPPNGPVPSKDAQPAMRHSTKTRRYFIAVVGLLSACDVPREVAPPPPPVAQKPAAPALSKQQIAVNSEQCSSRSRAQFSRDWKDGVEITAEGKTTAEFSNHYNAKSNTCFYLLTVSSPGTRKKMLFDINGGELYGEFQGVADIDLPKPPMPKACRVESFYCASEREWHVLIEPYMED